MEITQSSLTSLPEVTGQPAKAAKNTLDKDSFLLLLTTQLQHQDPLSPMDSNAFVAQLAQFASVEALEGMGKKLDSMLIGQANANQMSVPSLVGKEVRFRADQVGLVQGAPARFDVTLDGAADQAVAIVSDASGRPVRTLQLGARQAGTFQVSWDGLDERGNALPSGQYLLTVTASRADGAEVRAASAVRGVVTGVSFDGAVPELIVAGRRVRLGDVMEIAGPPAGA